VSAVEEERASQLVRALTDNERHLWQQQAQQLGLDEEQSLELATTVARQLEQTAGSELGRWCALVPHSDSQAEVGLTLWENAGPLALVIDRMFVVKHSAAPHERWIIDYKTASPDARSETQSAVQDAADDNWLSTELNRYAGQLSRYARAVRAMHPDQRIRTALYFTATDQLWETNHLEEGAEMPEPDELAQAKAPAIKLENGAWARSLTFDDVST